MTIAYIDVAKAPVQVPVIDLLQEPQGAAFDFISGQAWIVDKVTPANTMLRNIGDVLTNPGASPTKLLRRQSGLIEAAPWWSNEYDANGQPMGMRVEAQRTRINRYPTQIENAAWQKVNVDVVQADGQPGLSSGNVRKVVASAIEGVHQIALPCTLLDTVPIYAYTAIVEYDGTPYACVYENVTSTSASNRFGVQIDYK